MSPPENEPAWPPVELVSITAVGETDDGQVSIDVELANAPSYGHQDRWLHFALTKYIGEAHPDAVSHGAQTSSTPGPSSATVKMLVPPGAIEAAVRGICQALRDFNAAYPALYAEHRSEVERREAEDATKKERLLPYQEAIDRVMRE